MVLFVRAKLLFERAKLKSGKNLPIRHERLNPSRWLGLGQCYITKVES